MPTIRVLGTACAAIALIGLASAATSMAAEKQPPACAAIAFRPVPSGQADGDVDAGLYKSRFGRIEVKATVKSGETQNYFVEVNGKKLVPASTLPKSVEACAKAKRLSTPTKAEQACTGDRLTVLVDHSAANRYMLLYAHTGEGWRFCSAGIA